MADEQTPQPPCTCLWWAVHKDCPEHGWMFEGRKGNLAEALAKNPLQPTPHGKEPVTSKRQEQMAIRCPCYGREEHTQRMTFGAIDTPKQERCPTCGSEQRNRVFVPCIRFIGDIDRSQIDAWHTMLVEAMPEIDSI